MSVGRIALPILIATEIVLFAVPFWPQIPIEQFYPRTQSHDFLLQRLGSDRLVSAGLAMYPGTTSFYGLRSVTGHTFHDPAWRDLLEAVDPDVMRMSPTFSILASDVRIGVSPILDRLGARYFVVDPRVRLAGASTDMADQGTVMLHGGFETEIHAAGVLRGAVLRVPDGFNPGSNPDRLTVEIVDSNDVVQSSGFRRIDKWIPPGIIEVAVPEILDISDIVVRLRYEGDTPMSVVSGGDDEPSVGLITAEADELQVVFVGGTVVYERLSALPRIRWAGRSVVVADPDERIAVLAGGVAVDTVVLSEPGPSGSGRDARIEIASDSGDEITVVVQAEGDGYLVVADSMQRDWTAKVDDTLTPVVAADHAVAAVGVAAGRHTVTLTYTPEGWRMGTAISAGALALSLVIAVGAFLRRKPDANPASDLEV